MNLLARIVSLIFHPLLMATYLFTLLSFTLPTALDPIQQSGHNSFLLLIFLITFLLPAVNILIFKMIGSIKTFTMNDRRERLVPFTFISILYIVVTCFFYYNFKIGFGDNLFRLMLIGDGLIIVATAITFFYKLSVHSVAMWGILGIIVPLNKITEDDQLFIPTMVLIILAGLVMSSRLQLNAHKPREIMIGSLVGFCGGLLGILILF